MLDKKHVAFSGRLVIVGFLQGVEFFWTLRNLWIQTALVAGLLLAMFVLVDLWRYRSEPVVPRLEPQRRLLRPHGLRVGGH